MRAQAMALPVARARAADFVALAKPRLNLLVVAAATVAFYLGASGTFSVGLLLALVVGTTLVAAGASALNQLSERDIDGLMERTRRRPLPDGRIQPGEALWFGVATVTSGLLLLALGANLLAAAVALVTLATYLGIYTPLKRWTPYATVLGAVPGALPPLIGWAAADGRLTAPAWALFGIVFLWQIPHFFAIAWLLREDYRRAQLPVLPVVEPSGRRTSRQALLYGLVLIPVSLVPTAVGLAGVVYLWGALGLSVAFLALAVRFARCRTDATARGLFYGSLIYLPLIWALMIADRIPAGWS